MFSWSFYLFLYVCIHLVCLYTSYVYMSTSLEIREYIRISARLNLRRHTRCFVLITTLKSTVQEFVSGLTDTSKLAYGKATVVHYTLRNFGLLPIMTVSFWFPAFVRARSDIEVGVLRVSSIEIIQTTSPELANFTFNSRMWHRYVRWHVSLSD